VSISSKLFKYQRATALSWIRNNKKRIKFDVSSDEGLLDKVKSLEQEFLLLELGFLRRLSEEKFKLLLRRVIIRHLKNT
jgi:hypothetical protein